ncbi:fumarylacetoacetate hydrolase family protein [Streptomyces sp. NPDC002619]|uniref:fumarylacetoacetate hydrolase family protein n=1 Tax=Streptomyces sp. NPDC002619 TaxID=3364655 RepID=UPI0036CB03AF
MKFVRFGNWSTGVVVSGDRVLNLTAAVTSPSASRIPAAQIVRAFLSPDSVSWDAMIAGWPVVRPAVEELLDRAESGDPALPVRDLAALHLLPPLSSPRARVFAMAANFADHLARAFSVIKGAPFTEEHVEQQVLADLPSGFMVIPGTVIGPGAEIVPPPGQVKLDYEVEAAVIVGSPTPDGRLNPWGYTAWNDISVRDTYFPSGPRIDAGPLVWALQKNWLTGNAAGPWVVVEDGIDVQDLSLRSFVNGEKRQDGSTAKMMYPFQSTYDLLVPYVGLGPGDVLVSGTPMGTALEEGEHGPYLRPGDVIEIEVGDAGTRLRNIVGDF